MFDCPSPPAVFAEALATSDDPGHPGAEVGALRPHHAGATHARVMVRQLELRVSVPHHEPQAYIARLDGGVDGPVEAEAGELRDNSATNIRENGG